MHTQWRGLLVIVDRVSVSPVLMVMWSFISPNEMLRSAHVYVVHSLWKGGLWASRLDLWWDMWKGKGLQWLLSSVLGRVVLLAPYILASRWPQPSGESDQRVTRHMWKNPQILAKAVTNWQNLHFTQDIPSLEPGTWRLPSLWELSEHLLFSVDIPTGSHVLCH